MRMWIAVGFFIVAACGSKLNQSVCVEQPPPPACSMMCSPTGANTCPAGFYCGGNDKCTADCAAGGLQCPQGQQCTADGHCIGSGSGTDANCPNVPFTAMHTTP